MKKKNDDKMRSVKEQPLRELTAIELERIVGGSTLGPRGRDLLFLAVSEGTK